MNDLKFLTREQKCFYEENGFIVVDIFSTEETDEISEEYEAVFRRRNQDDLEATWKGNWKVEAKASNIQENEKKESQVKSIHSMQLHSAVFSRLLLHKKLLDACEDVMGTHNILLHHTKAHLKPPGTGSPFPMHQDYHYFPFKNHSMIAVFISVDASDPENGGLCVYPGSHKLGPLKDQSIDDGVHYINQDDFPLSGATPLALKKGQVVIFSYLLVHGSYPNTSTRVRRMHLTQLMAAEDEPIKEAHKSPCQGMVLRGVNVNMNADIKKRHEN